jgi:hypothetical protein
MMVVAAVEVYNMPNPGCLITFVSALPPYRKRTYLHSNRAHVLRGAPPRPILLAVRTQGKVCLLSNLCHECAQAMLEAGMHPGSAARIPRQGARSGQLGQRHNLRRVLRHEDDCVCQQQRAAAAVEHRHLRQRAHVLELGCSVPPAILTTSFMVGEHHV